jgi:hypothetical protein
MSNCNEPTSVEEAIQQNAMGPRRVQVADESVDQQSISEQIKAAQFLANQTAGQKAPWGIRFARIRPPGGGS